MIKASTRHGCSSAWRPIAVVAAPARAAAWRPRRRAPLRRARRRVRGAPPSAAAPSAAASYTIGYSNGGGVGNGFREEQVCTAKAEALASGQVVRAHHHPPQHGRRRPASRTSAT